MNSESKLEEENIGFRVLSQQKVFSPRALDPEIFGVPENEDVDEHIAKVRMVHELDRSALIVPMCIQQSSGRIITLRALIDTGCELNLIRRGLVGSEFFRPASTKYRLVTASGSLLLGGDNEITLGLVATGETSNSEEKLFFEFPTVLLEAEISVDVILSFRWLVDFDIDVRGRKYGLQTNTIPPYFIPGIQNLMSGSRCAMGRVNVVENKNKVKQKDVHSKQFFIRNTFPNELSNGAEDHLEMDYWKACQESLDPLTEKSLLYLLCLRLTAEPILEDRRDPPKLFD